jgi:hypothetical protein
MFLRSLHQLLIVLSLFACTSVFATPLTFDFSAIQSYGERGNEGNTVFELNVGANATVTGVRYNVNVTAYAPSFLSELGLAFSDSAATAGVLLTPGFGDNSSGTATYSELLDLVAQQLSFSVGDDGILRLEFYEDFGDRLFPDGIWNTGSLVFYFAGDVIDPGSGVPEPASALLLGAGLAMMGYCSRRRHRARAAA